MVDCAFTLNLFTELFFEQEHDALSIGYKHGFFRSVFVVMRALFAPGASDSRLAEKICSNSTVGIAFFENERRALSAAKRTIHIDQLVFLDLRSLPIIRGQLGVTGILVQAWRFTRLVVRLKGLAYLRRSSIPMIGWLLYHAFTSFLLRKSDLTIVTTNMVHPTSIGIVWATAAAGHRAVFFEHATTPTLIMKDRLYTDVYVNFEHTKELLVARGFARDRVHQIPGAQSIVPVKVASAIRRVAICINGYDTLDAVQDVTDAINNRGLEGIYRIHDADPRVETLRRFAAEHGVEVSLALESPIQEVLRSIDLVVCGNTNVIADALMAGKPLIYYWSGSDEMFDYYGFIAHYGLCQARNAREFDAVLAKLVSGEQC